MSFLIEYALLSLYVCWLLDYQISKFQGRDVSILQHLVNLFSIFKIYESISDDIQNLGNTVESNLKAFLVYVWHIHAAGIINELLV